MLKLKDILIVRHRESNEREFFFTVKVKEEDITLEQKELIRECTREAVPFDLEFTSGEATTEPSTEYDIIEHNKKVLERYQQNPDLNNSTFPVDNSISMQQDITEQL